LDFSPEMRQSGPKRQQAPHLSYDACDFLSDLSEMLFCFI